MSMVKQMFDNDHHLKGDGAAVSTCQQHGAVQLANASTQQATPHHPALRISMEDFRSHLDELGNVGRVYRQVFPITMAKAVEP